MRKWPALVGTVVANVGGELSLLKMAIDMANADYRKTSSISRTLVGNKTVDNSDVVGASPVGAAPTTSSFSTERMASMDWAKTTARGYKKDLSFRIWCDLYLGFYGTCSFFYGTNWSLPPTAGNGVPGVTSRDT